MFLSLSIIHGYNVEEKHNSPKKKKDMDSRKKNMFLFFHLK